MSVSRYAKGRIKLLKGEYVRSNQTYEYRWTDKNGKCHYIYAKSLSELRKKEDEIAQKIIDGLDYAKLDATVNSYYELWKELKTGVRGTTYANYIRFYERYIEPDIGKVKLRDLTYSRVVMFFKNLALKRGLSYSTISKVEVPLSMILDIAVKDDVIRSNPCRGALRELQRAYGSNAKIIRGLTLKEQRVFETFLAKPGPYHLYYPVFTVMLWTGMRVGEVIGLRWEDIDFDNNEIDVNHNLNFYDLGKGKGSTYSINPPKTKSSIRKVPMLPIVREALLEEKKHLETVGIKCNSVIDGYTDFIFLNSKGHVYSHKKLNHQLNKICNAINKELRESPDPELTTFPHVHNHMLRHTFATRMREAGADVKATSEMMGHEGILITLTTYTDASSEFKKREIGVLQDYYEKAT